MRWTDVDVARTVSTTLRGGLLLAALIVTIGGGAHLLQHGGDPVAYAVFRGEPRSLRTIPGILDGATRGAPLAVIQLGVLLLIATPIARVALSLIGFQREGDRRYVAITGIVLTILLFSLVGRL